MKSTILWGNKLWLCVAILACVQAAVGPKVFLAKNLDRDLIVWAEHITARRANGDIGHGWGRVRNDRRAGCWLRRLISGNNLGR